MTVSAATTSVTAPGPAPLPNMGLLSLGLGGNNETISLIAEWEFSLDGLAMEMDHHIDITGRTGNCLEPILGTKYPHEKIGA